MSFKVLYGLVDAVSLEHLFPRLGGSILYVVTQPLHYEQDVVQDQFLSRVVGIQFSFSYTGSHTKVKESNLSYLPRAGAARIGRFIPFPREMQTT